MKQLSKQEIQELLQEKCGFELISERKKSSYLHVCDNEIECKVENAAFIGR